MIRILRSANGETGTSQFATFSPPIWRPIFPLYGYYTGSHIMSYEGQAILAAARYDKTAAQRAILDISTVRPSVHGRFLRRLQGYGLLPSCLYCVTYSVPAPTPVRTGPS